MQIIAKPSPEEESRLDKLEAKVGELEGRQDRFEKKFDQRLDGVDDALRQLLQRCDPGRPREPLGDTPPSKYAKNAWDAWEAPSPRSWILDFLVLWTFTLRLIPFAFALRVRSHASLPTLTCIVKAPYVIWIELLWMLLGSCVVRLPDTLMLCLSFPQFFSLDFWTLDFLLPSSQLLDFLCFCERGWSDLVPYGLWRGGCESQFACSQRMAFCRRHLQRRKSKTSLRLHAAWVAFRDMDEQFFHWHVESCWQLQTRCHVLWCDTGFPGWRSLFPRWQMHDNSFCEYRVYQHQLFMEDFVCRRSLHPGD